MEDQFINEQLIALIIGGLDQADRNLLALKERQNEQSDESNADNIDQAERALSDLRATVEDIVP